MAGRRRHDREACEATSSLRGNRLIKPIKHLIEKLHCVGTKRDRAANRKLFFDQDATLLLLYFFTPGGQPARGEGVRSTCLPRPLCGGSARLHSARTSQSEAMAWRSGASAEGSAK